jgi:hypothetical protein
MAARLRLMDAQTTAEVKPQQAQRGHTMALKAYYIEEQKLDGVWLVLDRPGGDVVTTRASQSEAVSWVETHHPHADVHIADGVGENKWRQKK